MLSFVEKLIWQPNYLAGGNGDFEIYLDRVFAQEMIRKSLSPANQQKVFELAQKELKRLGGYAACPIIFHNNTCFAINFSYHGTRGVYMYTDQNLDSLTDPAEVSQELIKFSTHNVERGGDVFGLMGMFNFWIYYADTIKGLG